MAYLDIIGSGTVLHPDAKSVNDPDSEDLATHAADASAHGLGLTWEEKYLARGLSRSGLTVGEAGWFFEEFTDIARWQAILGGVTALTNVAGGVVHVANAVADLIGNGSAPLGNPRIAKADSLYYIATRIRVNATVAGCGSAVGMTNAVGGAYVAVGYMQPADATHYVGGYTDDVNPLEVIVSTVGVDAGWHDLEFWCDATRYWLAVDNETPISRVPTHAPPQMMFAFFIAQANGDMDVDKALWVFPQAA